MRRKGRIFEDTVSKSWAALLTGGFLIVAALILFPNTVGFRIMPSAFAETNFCVGRSSDWTYSNRCEFDINLRYCLLDRDSTNIEDRCESIPIPQDGSISAMPLFESLNDYAGLSQFTCRDPFWPATDQTGQIVCLRREED
ncbi:hypothetical protein [Ponticaulis sp.]|uniref:hypothetical protein n=1 Tax=Ponticaulis sp. TaxID=2020902 RepID=UPI000B6AE89C|nr:hypothetical protein [Ponticaulis sp.]MAI90383.1 hypothetical protein [Ponticaulis sp.]OUY00086.1 MAG: hypothetical protein CBB65_08085 [Hyphomonadaceae bacterium TMED5]|tara:strand:+ start:2044 stop:2466 length:423 start_codon:yes stop_codon:yes gene_type:complete